MPKSQRPVTFIECSGCGTFIRCHCRGNEGSWISRRSATTLTGSGTSWSGCIGGGALFARWRSSCRSNHRIDEDNVLACGFDIDRAESEGFSDANDRNDVNEDKTPSTPSRLCISFGIRTSQWLTNSPACSTTSTPNARAQSSREAPA